MTVEVTQEDREIAADLEDWERDDSKRERFMDGDFDHTFAVQAFARHRIASTRAAAERIAELEGALNWIDLHGDDQDMNHVNYRIGAASRARAALQHKEPKP